MEKETIVENNQDNNITKLVSLTPQNKKDDPRVFKYLIHLDNAIQNLEIKNLALTGVYGSGKSTIIKSYKSKHPDKTLLNISLSSFNEDDKYVEFKDKIQLTILQQIIYSQSSEKLPDSRINRIHEIDIWKKEFYIKIITLLLFITSTYSIIVFYKNQLNPNYWRFFLDINWGAILSFFVFLGSSFHMGQLLFKALFSSKINKINIKGEAELGDKTESKDFLNKYLDEILYFFEKNPTDIVVIEDLDRFNTTEIYRTLREINFIINNYLENTKGDKFKKVTFLYAIKDDLFTNELDRTKFFDLIIPTIPFVNFNNSKNVLTKKLIEIYGSEKEIFNKPNNNKSLINTVSTFITDNRILLNIINEFIIYKEQQKLHQEEFNQENLLAIIIYKNLRPKDFSKLHLGKSNIDFAFTNKPQLTKSVIDQYDARVEILINEIEIIKHENLKNIANLNTIFLYHIKEQNLSANASGLIIDSEKISFKKIITDKIDLSLLSGNIQYYIEGYSHLHNTEIKLNTIEKSLGYKYSNKYNSIKDKDIYIKTKENEIKRITAQIRKLHNQTLKQTLGNKDLSKIDLKDKLRELYKSNDVDETERIYNDPFLIFLLENGYIDEHYREYISTFQKGGLSENDQKFKINILSVFNTPKPFDYKLNNVFDIIEELPINYFNDSRILNKDLIDYLINNEEEFPTKLEAVLTTIIKWDERSKKFFIECLLTESEKKLFFQKLFQFWKNIWVIIDSDSTLLEDQKRCLSILILTISSDEVIMSINQESIFSNYIAENFEVLLDIKTEKHLKRIEDIFSEKILNIKFLNLIKISEKHETHLDLVYNKNYYEINQNNIMVLLEAYGNKNDFEKLFLSNNYETILKSGCTPVIEYINTYINEYLQNIYFKIKAKNLEKEKILVKHFIDNGKIDDETKLKIISTTETIFTELYNIDDPKLKNRLIELNRTLPTWDNIYTYLYDLEDTYINKTLINFYNSETNYIQLSTQKLETSDKTAEDFYQNMKNAILTCDELTINAYKNLILSIDYKYSNLEFEHISDEKVNLLINQKMLNLTVINYERLRENFPYKHINLIENNPHRFIINITHYQTNETDLTKILSSKKITFKQKLVIIKTITKDNLETSLLLSEKVSEIIILKKYLILNTSQLKAILAHNLSIEVRIKLFLLYLKNDMLLETILSFLKVLPHQYYKIATKRQSALKNNKYNRELIDILKANNIISSAEPKHETNEIKLWMKSF